MPVWVFRFGDVFDPEDPLSVSICTLGIAFNDVIYANVRVEEATKVWERFYGWRVAIGHFNEAAVHLERGRKIKEVVQFLRDCGAGEIAARETGELSLADALAFCLLLADADPPRFDRAIARWHARFVLKTQGITAAEAALALLAAQALAGLKTRDVAAHTLRHLAASYGISSVVQSLAKVGTC